MSCDRGYTQTNGFVVLKYYFKRFTIFIKPTKALWHVSKIDLHDALNRECALVVLTRFVKNLYFDFKTIQTISRIFLENPNKFYVN